MDISHSMDEKPLTCPKCNSEDTLERDYTVAFSLNKRAQFDKPPAGQIVRDFIENTKEELRHEKQTLLKEQCDD
tara:strand:- start:111 stop:332 length:222 start_codon:yes stop_codon:yes gene_type:complete